MRLQRLTNYLLLHRWQALLLTVASTFIPIIGTIGIIFAALVTLRKGIIEGAIFTAAATLPYLVSFYWGNEETAVPLVFWAAVGVAVLSNVMTWVFASMLRRQASFGAVLQVAALLGVLAVSVVHLFYPDITEWWGIELQSYYAQAQSVATALKTQATSSVEMPLETINATKQYATGLMIAAILFNAMIQLIIACWWQASVFNPGGLRKMLHYIRLSHLAGILFLVSLGLSYWGNSVISDMMPVLYLLFAAAGLSLIHYLFNLMPSSMSWFWLSLLYLALIISLPISIMIVAVLAVVDVWLDIRKRFKKG